MGWEKAPFGLHARQYALMVCQELRWPKSGNVDLVGECIVALSSEGNAHFGFVKLMEAITLAKEQGMKVDRWFFQDGKYNNFEMVEEVAAEPPVEVVHPARRPN
jgi:hypothetical protein